VRWGRNDLASIVISFGGLMSSAFPDASCTNVMNGIVEQIRASFYGKSKEARYRGWTKLSILEPNKHHQKCRLRGRLPKTRFGHTL
jgi:hypothetical protein